MVYKKIVFILTIIKSYLKSTKNEFKELESSMQMVSVTTHGALCIISGVNYRVLMWSAHKNIHINTAHNYTLNDPKRAILCYHNDMLSSTNLSYHLLFIVIIIIINHKDSLNIHGYHSYTCLEPPLPRLFVLATQGEDSS